MSNFRNRNFPKIWYGTDRFYFSGKLWTLVIREFKSCCTPKREHLGNVNKCPSTGIKCTIGNWDCLFLAKNEPTFESLLINILRRRTRQLEHYSAARYLVINKGLDSWKNCLVFILCESNIANFYHLLCYQSIL